MCSSTKVALCLLLVVVVATVGAASAAAAKPLPGSCLMAASTLCANADTNAMRCLTKLAIAGDARVPAACAEALMAGMTKHPPRPTEADRASRLFRMLNEGGGSCGATGNSCPSNFAGGNNNFCNDVQLGCGGCPQGTYTVTATHKLFLVVTSQDPNTIGKNCANICCQAANGNPACCWSNVGGSVYCIESGHVRCQAG